MDATFFNRSNLDYSAAKNGFLLQYEPEVVGSFAGIALGTESSIPSLSLINGSTNTLSGTLAPAPASQFDLSVKGSEWSTAFQNVAPGTALQSTRSRMSLRSPIPLQMFWLQPHALT